MEFLAQINLDELKLPELKGMLYLFYDLYAVCEGEISSDSVAVVYCPEHDELARCAFVSESGEADEDYDENATGVYKINFGEGSNTFLDENGNNVTLFSFDFPTTEYGLDGKRLTVTISIQDLKKANFKNAVLSID